MQILQICPVHLHVIDIMVKFMMIILLCIIIPLVRNPFSSIVKSDTNVHTFTIFIRYTVFCLKSICICFYNILYKYFIIRFHTSFSLLQMSDAAKIMVLYYMHVYCEFLSRISFFLHCYNVAFINQIKDLQIAYSVILSVYMYTIFRNYEIAYIIQTF